MVADSNSEFTQPFAQMTQELSANLMRNAEMTFHETVEILTEQDSNPAVAGSSGLCGSNGVIEQPEFAEELAREKPGQEPVLRSALPTNRHFAFEDDIHRLSRFPFVENDLPRHVLADVQQGGENGQLLYGQLGK